MTVSNTPGAPCWIELFTSDQAASGRFYSDVFGWEAGEPDESYGGYAMFFREGRPIAGCMRNDGSAGAPDAWTVYLETGDVEATAARAEKAGGQVVTGPLEIGPLGSMCVVLDPAGAAVGAWQPGEFHGVATLAQDGAPAWFETLSTRYDDAVRFYTDVFDWDAHTMSDTEDFRYTTLGEGDRAMAGILDAAAMLGDDSSVWRFYVLVPDTDATVATAQRAGAATVVPAEDTPYGRVAVFTDPQGVSCAVMGPVAGS